MGEHEGGVVAKLDDIFHSKARLGIMTLLMAWGKADFATLKQHLELTDGNLGAHIRVLEQAGFVEVEKTFVARKPRTVLKASLQGRTAFRGYLSELERLIRIAKA